MALEPVHEGIIPCARADYPPRVHSIEFLGQVRDANSRNYARTHGCSTLLNYEPIFLFNDTFEVSRAPRFPRMEYRPIASITAAFGSLSDPTITTYPTYTDRRHIPQFIPFSRAERVAGAARGCYLTVFNSVVQVPGKEFGVVWFMRMRGGRGGADVFCGVGVAEVKIDAEGAPRCERKDELVFDGLGPRWGDISTVLHGDYIYLYGSGAPTSFANDGTCGGPIYQATPPTTTGASRLDVPIYLCRVPYRNRAYWHAENYKYWNGEAFVNFPPASQSPFSSFYYQQGRFTPPPEFKCVMKNVQSGTVMHAQLFTERGHFIFIGCELGGSSDDKKEAMVKIRLADEPMGPWFGEASLFDLNAANRGNKGVRFGVHTHHWASDLENGEIMVSWTEPWPGSVEMAKVKLAMQPSPSRDMESTATTTATANQPSRHRRKNARMTFSAYFEEEPIPEDPEPEPEPEEDEVDLVVEADPEVEVDPELGLCKRDKARNKALAKLAGVYSREEDSDSDTESVFNLKSAFENMLAPRGGASPSFCLPESSKSSILRPYSGYDQRTAIPDGLTGSWILEERDYHYPDDAFDDRDSQGQRTPTVPGEQELEKEGEEEAEEAEEEEEEAAAKGDNHNSSSTTTSSPRNNNHSSFWLQDSDTNTEYSATVSPVSSRIAFAIDPAHHSPPPDPNNMYGSSSLLPGIEEIMAGHPLSVFDTHSSSQTGTTTIGKGKKSAIKKLLWGKKPQAEAEEEGVGGDGNEKKGWKNSIKKSAIGKFLMGGGE